MAPGEQPLLRHLRRHRRHRHPVRAHRERRHRHDPERRRHRRPGPPVRPGAARPLRVPDGARPHHPARRSTPTRARSCTEPSSASPTGCGPASSTPWTGAPRAGPRRRVHHTVHQGFRPEAITQEMLALYGDRVDRTPLAAGGDPPRVVTTALPDLEVTADRRAGRSTTSRPRRSSCPATRARTRAEPLRRVRPRRPRRLGGGADHERRRLPGRGLRRRRRGPRPARRRWPTPGMTVPVRAPLGLDATAGRPRRRPAPATASPTSSTASASCPTTSPPWRSRWPRPRRGRPARPEPDEDCQRRSYGRAWRLGHSRHRHPATAGGGVVAVGAPPACEILVRRRIEVLAEGDPRQPWHEASTWARRRRGRCARRAGLTGARARGRRRPGRGARRGHGRRPPGARRRHRRRARDLPPAGQILRNHTLLHSAEGEALPLGAHVRRRRGRSCRSPALPTRRRCRWLATPAAASGWARRRAAPGQPTTASPTVVALEALASEGDGERSDGVRGRGSRPRAGRGGRPARRRCRPRQPGPRWSR